MYKLKFFIAVTLFVIIIGIAAVCFIYAANNGGNKPETASFKGNLIDLKAIIKKEVKPLY